MKNFLKENWFQVIIIFLLIMSYQKLWEIANDTSFSTDIIETGNNQIRYSLDDIYSRLGNIQSDIQSIYYEIK